MNKRNKPLFLARHSYRRRRLIDAARLLPILGWGLMLVPLLWTTPNSGSLAARGIYLFIVWGLLVAFSAYFARALAAEPEGADDEQARLADNEASDVI